MFILKVTMYISLIRGYRHTGNRRSVQRTTMNLYAGFSLSPNAFSKWNKRGEETEKWDGRTKTESEDWTHTHTHLHTLTHLQNTHKHTHIHTLTHLQDTHKHTHTYIHSHTYTHIHKHIRRGKIL